MDGSFKEEISVAILNVCDHMHAKACPNMGKFHRESPRVCDRFHGVEHILQKQPPDVLYKKWCS